MCLWYLVNYNRALTFWLSIVLIVASWIVYIFITSLKSNGHSLESSLITELQNTVFMKVIYLR